MRFQTRTEKIKSAMVSKCLQLRLPAILLILLSSFASGAQDMNKPSFSETNVTEQCASNLRHIYRLLKLHLHHSAGAMGFPTNLDLLYGMSKDPKVFICPADKGLETAGKPDTFRTSYEIVSNPLEPKLATMPASRIAIVVEKRANHNGRRFVLFYDGSVKAFDDSQFDKLKGDSFIDKERIESETVDPKTGATNKPKP